MEEKDENVVEETTQENVEETHQEEKSPEVDLSKFESADDPEVMKIDLSKPPKTEENEQPVDNTKTEEVQEKVIEETTDKEEVTEQSTEEDTKQPVLEEITDEAEETTEELEEQVEEAVAEVEATGKPIPENIQKLMDFMEETGGDLNDYINLNKDYSDFNEESLLKEYYTQTKPHLDNNEIDFLIEDQFSYDEDIDDERDIRRKKLALKEQVANAKTQLEENKSKYYEDIKAGSKLTSEQQKAVDFFNRYNKKSEEDAKASKYSRDVFNKRTNEVFNNKFKGFEFGVGDKKFRFNVKDIDSIKETQSDLNNTFKKFLNEKNEIEDAAGYHKSIFTAMNADAVANHFYEQGKADAMKDSVAKAKNVNMNPRQSHGEIKAGGLKFRILGEDSDDFKIKIKNKR